MARTDAAWERLGDAVWARFRLIGVPDAAKAAHAWLSDPATSAWVKSGKKTSLTRLLLESTDAALARRESTPDPSAGAMFLGNTKQMKRILDGPVNLRKALMLSVIDGLDEDEVASLLGMTATSVKMALDAVEDDLAELADPAPEGSLEDGHLSTIQLHGFARETLDPLQMEQIEQHLAACSMCFARFDAWSANRADFEALPKMAAPRRSRAVPLLIAGFLMLLVAGGVLTGVAVALSQSAPPDPAELPWAGEAPTVELKTGAGALEGGNQVAVGDVVQIWLDPNRASHAAFATGVQGEVQNVLAVVPVEPRGGLQLAPVEVLVTSEGPSTLWVVVSDSAFGEDQARAAAGAGADGLTATRVDLQITD